MYIIIILLWTLDTVVLYKLLYGESMLYYFSPGLRHWSVLDVTILCSVDYYIYDYNISHYCNEAICVRVHYRLVTLCYMQHVIVVMLIWCQRYYQVEYLWILAMMWVGTLYICNYVHLYVCSLFVTSWSIIIRIIVSSCTSHENNFF